MNALSLYCLQHDIAWEDPATNYAKVLDLLETAAPPPGSLVALPEMFSTGFSMDVDKIADETRATQMFLAATASKFEVCLLAGLATRGQNGKGRNEVYAQGPDGRELARFCKLHPFTFSGEPDYYEAGTEIVLFEWQGWKIAPFICYDLRFPEVFREAARQGAELFVVAANWPAAREAHWLALLQARAIENQAYVAGINRCGNSPKHAYSGRSLIVDPRGAIVADAGNEETAISAQLDRAALHAYRQEFPALADRKW